MSDTPLRIDHVTIGGVPTRTIRAEGDPGKVRFLFLHGFSDSADCWQRVQKRLAAAGHGSLAVDQPSHGFADPLDPELPVIEQFLSFAAAAARATDHGRPVVVCGNSLGGAHALLLGQHHPDLVHGVAPISPAAFDHPGWFRILDSQRFQAQPGVVPSVLSRALAGPAMRAVGFGMPHRVPTGFVRTWSRHWSDPTRRRALHDLASRVPAEYFHADPVDLCAIDVPVLAIWGTRDRLTLISSRARFEQDCADLEFVALPGVGHMAQVEVPGRTTKHLLAFAARVVGEAGDVVVPEPAMQAIA
jgi:pimeloyl-ACP methyl ester carboxylesterase